MHHRNRRIEYPGIFSHEVRRCKTIQAHRTSVARFPLHKRLQERACTVVQRAVVRMVAHARIVKCNENIDGGIGRGVVHSRGSTVRPPSYARTRGFRRVGRGGQVGRERGGQEGGDAACGPGRGHAIRETRRVVDNEDVGFAAESEAHGALLELGFADVAETVCVAWKDTGGVSHGTLYSPYVGSSIASHRTCAQAKDLDVVP